MEHKNKIINIILLVSFIIYQFLIFYELNNIQSEAPIIKLFSIILCEIIIIMMSLWVFLVTRNPSSEKKP